MSLFAVKNVLILDSEGKRILARYYSDEFGNLQQQKKYEANLFTKTKRGEAEIVQFERNITVFERASDIHFYVTGSTDENELILVEVLQGLIGAMSSLVKGQLGKEVVFDNLDLLFLVVDEAIDNGIILESNPQTVAERVKLGAIGEREGLAVGEGQSVAQAFQTAKEQIVRSLNRG